MVRIFLCFLLMGLSPALAQPPVQILRAEWGAGQTWLDVTQRVQALLDARQSSFRVDADALGADPLPGTQKTLRVRTRAANGSVQMFEYKDLETVDLRSWLGRGRDMRTPPGRGRFGGDLQVLNAQYGDGRRQNDVTTLLNNSIRNNALELQVTNRNLGGDPAVAARKQLTVEYQWRGQTHTATVPENGWLRLPGAATPVGLRIVEASYGDGPRQLDVTSRLQALVENDSLRLQVTNNMMGGDPARGADKTLTVVYEWQGSRYQTSVKEEKILTLPGTGDRRQETTALAPADAGRFFDSADQVWKLRGDGVCFYRQAYFKGDAVCVQTGQQAASLNVSGSSQVLSLRLFGNVRQVQFWNQTNFSGRPDRFTRDVTDFGREAGGAVTLASARVD